MLKFCWEIFVKQAARNFDQPDGSKIKNDVVVDGVLLRQSEFRIHVYVHHTSTSIVCLRALQIYEHYIFTNIGRKRLPLVYRHYAFTSTTQLKAAHAYVQRTCIGECSKFVSTACLHACKPHPDIPIHTKQYWVNVRQSNWHSYTKSYSSDAYLRLRIYTPLY